MTDKVKSPDQIIHEAMGFCWHSDGLCGCGGSVMASVNAFCPDHSKDLRPVFGWMQKEGRWRIFGNWVLRERDLSLKGYRFNALSFERQRDLIAQWIESTRE